MFSAIIRFSFAFLLLVGGGGRALSEATEPLQLQVEVMSFPTKDGGTTTQYLVSLTNTGNDDITVLTDRLEQMREKTSKNPGTLELTFGLATAATDKKGRRIIPSMARHAPVILRKNETAILNLDDSTSPFGGPFKGLPDQGQVTVTYKIAKEWGDRFGIWHGSVSTALFQIENGSLVSRQRICMKRVFIVLAA